MVAKLSLALLALGILGCQGDGASKDPAMNTPSAANGPKLDDWVKANPDNGKPGHGKDK